MLPSIATAGKWRRNGRSKSWARAPPTPWAAASPSSASAAGPASTGIPNSLYRRMRTNAAASVKDGRYYLQLAGAEARERLLLAAAKSWGVPVEEVSSANSVITHRPTGRTTTYGQVAPLAAQTPHPNPERIRIKPPSEWTLMGTEQKNLDVPLESHRQDHLRHRRQAARHEMGGRQGLPGLWRHGEELRFRAHPQPSPASSRRSSSRSPIRP